MKSTIYFIILLMLGFVGCSSNSNNKIEASGTIESTNVIVSSKVRGEIEQMLFTEGDKVTKGDTLYIIDSEELLYQKNRAEAAVNMADAQLKLMLKGARKEDVLQAKALLMQAEVSYNNTKKDKERIENLYKKNAVSEKQYDDINSAYKIALSKYNSAKENFSKISKLTRPEELQQAEARLAEANANLNLIKKQFNDSYITSPAKGFVVKKFFEVGEFVNPSSSLLKISDLSKVELIIYVSEIELGAVQLGQTADVYVDAYPDKNFEGKVTYISPEAEFTPKNIQTKDERTKLVFAVKIELNNPEFKLKPGMPADAIIKIAG